MQIKLAIWLVICVLLSSCTEQTHLPWYFSLHRNPEKGIVFGSIMFTGFMTADSIYIRKVGGGEESKMTFGDLVTLNPIPPPGDFRHYGYDSFKHKGALVAEALEPGNYEVYGWTIGDDLGKGPYVHNFKIPFTIKSGQATYVGSYEFVHKELAMAVSGGGGTLLDQYARDLVVFKHKYPAMQDTPAIDAISSLTFPMDIGVE
jgi:hypothetical protein